MKTSLVLPLFLFGVVGRGATALAQSAGAFTATASMATPRVWHTATLLPDGHVLIAGGAAAGGVNLASAELFDPSTRIFSPTANMSVARIEHTATLLPNGKVLIAGSDGVTTPGSAELYDPKAGTFTVTGSMMADGSYFHTATLLPDGRVLFVAQGYYGSGAQVYDPSTGAFASTGSPSAAPYGYNTATPLVDGSIFITQGSEIEAEVYDPRGGAFGRTPPRFPWIQGMAALLMNGKILLAGGNDDTGQSALAGIYDPSTVGFPTTGMMTVPRSHASITLLPNGTVLIAGSEGALTPGEINFTLNSAELYDPATKTFTRTADMNVARGFHTATLLKNGQIPIAGGLREGAETGWDALSSAELYTPASIIPAPVLFSLSGDGKWQGAIWHAATGHVASANNPAIAGEALSLYTTSLVDSGVIPPQVALGGKLAESCSLATLPDIRATTR